MTNLARQTYSTILERSTARYALSVLCASPPGGLASVRQNWDYFVYLCSVLEVEPITEMTHRLELKGAVEEYAIMEIVKSVVEYHHLSCESAAVFEEIVRAGGPISPTALDLLLDVKRSVVMGEINRFADLRLIEIERIGRIRRIRVNWNLNLLSKLQDEKHRASYDFAAAKLAYRELASA